jgi:predicted TIM-barrel fold metal-dependent hydrolase
MPAIDMHTHAFPDKLAPRAVAKLQDLAQWQAVGDGTVDDLVASMDAADVDVSVVCPIATKPDQVRGIFKWCRKIRSQRIEPFASVHPQTQKPEKWLRRFAEKGLAGIKLHPMYQDFALDEKRMDPIYAAAAQNDLIVTVHAGRDIAFAPTDDRAAPWRIANVLDRHPSLRLLATHLGGWEVWDQVPEHLVGKNVYFETSFSLGRIQPEHACDLIRSHGVEKVLLGTDWPWNNQAAEIHQLEALPLDDREKSRILYANAVDLLGL